MSLLTIRNLSIGYDSNVILDNINFTVDSGDYLCIVGENGSGKTTLMRTILRLQNPIGGQILYGDGLNDHEIGYLPQQTNIQKDFPATVKEVVLSGCQGHCGYRPFYTKNEKKNALMNMDRMGITPLAKRCFSELSGGQQQRVLLARALCATRKIILLDEPVSGLDPIVTADMYDLISDLNKEGITIIMISHDVDAAIQYASHILHIGSSVYYGPANDYSESEIGKSFLEKGGDQ